MKYCPSSLDSLGYIPLFHVWNGHTILNGIVEYEDYIHYENTFSKRIVSIAQQCDSLGVRLIFVQPPVGDFHLQNSDPRLYNSFDSLMNCLALKLNMEYKSYFNNAEFRPDSLYADEFHLNHQGATKFAQCVKEDLNL